jgi:hypothetical protein
MDGNGECYSSFILDETNGGGLGGVKRETVLRCRGLTGLATDGWGRSGVGPARAVAASMRATCVVEGFPSAPF